MRHTTATSPHQDDATNYSKRLSLFKKEKTWLSQQQQNMKNKEEMNTNNEVTKGRYKKRNFEVDQMRFSLRIDKELSDWVEEQSKGITKNRYINGLIRQDMEASMLKDMAIKKGMTVGEAMTASRMSFEDFDERVTNQVKEDIARHKRNKDK